MFAETANLVARLSLKDDFSKPIGKVRGQIKGLGQSLGRAGRTAGIAIGAAVTVGAAIVTNQVRAGLDSLAELESATTSVEGAIKQMGLTGKVTGAQIAGWANEVEANVQAAFDDKEITQAATSLIRFGKIGVANIKPALQVMTDLATKTGSIESAGKILAKAFADPANAAGALRKAGVVLDAQQQKQLKSFGALTEEEQAHYDQLSKSNKKAAELYKQTAIANKQIAGQAFLLQQLQKATEGAAAAMNGPFVDAQNIWIDVKEDAQRALATGFIPVLTELRTLLSEELAKPETLDNIKKFGEGLAGGLKGLIQTARGLPWNDIGNSLKIAGAGAKAVWTAFSSLPGWVQGAVLTGWGLNKLTGGLVGTIVGELGKGLIKGVLGMTAGVVNIKAGVVTGAGGVPTGGGAVPVGAKGGIGALGKVFLVGEAVGLVAAVIGVADAIGAAGLAQAKDIGTVLDKSLAGPQSLAELTTKLTGINEGIERLAHDPITAAIYHDTLVELETMRAKVVAALNEQTASQDQREAARIALLSGQKPPKGDLTPKQQRIADRAEAAAAKQKTAVDAAKAAIDRARDAIETARIATVSGQKTSTAAIVAAINRALSVPFVDKGDSGNRGGATQETGAASIVAAISGMSEGNIARTMNSGMTDALDRQLANSGNLQWRPSDVVQVEDRRGDGRAMRAEQRAEQHESMLIARAARMEDYAGEEAFDRAQARDAIESSRIAIVSQIGTGDASIIAQIVAQKAATDRARDAIETSRIALTTSLGAQPAAIAGAITAQQAAQQAAIDRARDAIESARIANASQQQSTRAAASSDTDRIVAAINRNGSPKVTVFVDKGDTGNRPKAGKVVNTSNRPAGPGHSGQ